MKFALVLLPLLALTTWAEDDSLMTIHRLETETADRIQARVLDPILGAGQSSIFVKLKLEVKREYAYDDRSAEGQSTKIKSKTELVVATTTSTANTSENDSLFKSFGLDNSTIPPFQPNLEKRTQEARQSKGVKEERFTVSKRYTEFTVVILHDAKVPAGKLAGVRSALLASYRPENINIKFHTVEFSAPK